VSPFRSTPLDSLRELCDALISLQLLNGDWNSQVLYDLGCGDGIVNVELAKRFGTRGVGIDLDEALIAKANTLSDAQGVSNLVSFRIQDLLKADLSESTILFMYLLPEALEKLKPILEEQIRRPGVLLIVEQWPLLGWEHYLVYTHSQGKFRVYRSEPSSKTQPTETV
jgi:predicted TPR repeat methyltransferase